MPCVPVRDAFDCDVEGNARAMPALAPATIVGLAKSAGVDVETIRSYERMGLLPSRAASPAAAVMLPIIANTSSA
jgi:hypothetical protein